MASLFEIRTAIREAINAQIEGMIVYDHPDEIMEVPCIVVELSPKDTADFKGAMGRGLDTWNFDLCVLVSTAGDTGIAHQELSEYISGAGPKSIREIFFELPSLCDDGTDGFVDGIRDYGGKFQQASERNIAHLGAIVRLVVRTPGS